jgi:hypothetical protein
MESSMPRHHISDIHNPSGQAAPERRISRTVDQSAFDKMGIHIEHRRYLVSQDISIGEMKFSSDDADDFSHGAEDALPSRRIVGNRTNCR